MSRTLKFINRGRKSSNKQQYKDIQPTYPPYPIQEDMIQWARGIMLAKEKTIGLLLGYRKCGKSYYISIYLVAKMLLENPHLTFAIMCRTEVRAIEIVETIGSMLKESGVKGDYSKKTIRLTQNKGKQQPTVKALTITSSTKGNHADIMIMDDPIEPTDEYSSVMKARAEKILYEAQNICTNLIVIGQYVAPDDIFCQLEEKEVVKKFNLWVKDLPELAPNREDLLSKMTLREYGKNYEGIWYTDEGAPFNEIKYNHTDNYQYMVVDPSLEGGDYTAISFIAKNDKEFTVFGKVYKMNWLDALKQVKPLYDTFSISNIVVESNILGNSVRPLISDMFNVKYLSLRKTTSNKVQRISRLDPYVKGNRLFLDERSDNTFIQQFINWSPRTKDYDDAPDSVSIFFEYFYGLK